MKLFRSPIENTAIVLTEGQPQVESYENIGRKNAYEVIIGVHPYHIRDGGDGFDFKMTLLGKCERVTIFQGKIGPQEIRKIRVSLNNIECINHSINIKNEILDTSDNGVLDVGILLSPQIIN
jgi:hypothetical protein